MSPPFRNDNSDEGASPSQPTGANHGTHRPGPVAATWVGSEADALRCSTVLLLYRLVFHPA